MICVVCPECQKKLYVKVRLAGRSCECPKCGNSLSIPHLRDAAELREEGLEAVLSTKSLPPDTPPARLDGNNRYLVVDQERIVCIWRNNGQGWRVRTKWGYVSASRNPDKLPSVGTFTLVELVIVPTRAGTRLRGIACYRLANQWALTSIEQGEDRILGKTASPGGLNRTQKADIMLFLAEEFMDEVWLKSPVVVDFLANDDCVAHGVLCVARQPGP